MAAPSPIGVSTGAGNSAATTISFSSSGRQAGDKLYIAVMTANQAVTISGWTEVATYSPQSRGTAGAAGGVRLTLFEKVSDGTETNVSTSDSGDIQFAAGLVVRGDGGAAAEIDIGAGNNVAATTSGSFGGVTTTGADRLICHFVATDRDISAASWGTATNANLANLTERFDNGITTNSGGGIAIWTGEMASAGATGNTTSTQAASAAYCWITLALKNAAGATLIGTATETDSGQPLARSAQAGVGAATEGDGAQPLSRRQSLGLGAAAESDAALVIGAVQLRGVGIAGESDTALPLSQSGVPIGVAAESDLALGLAAAALRAISTATELDSALGLVGTQIAAIGTGSESGSALALGRLQRLSIGTATEADMARPLAAVQIRTIGAGAESDSAQPLGAAAMLAIGWSAEADAALGLGRSTAIGVGTAEEADIAGAFADGVSVPIGVAAEADFALPLPGEQLISVPRQTVRHSQQLRALRPSALPTAARPTSVAALVPGRPGRRSAATRQRQVSRGRR